MLAQLGSWTGLGGKEVVVKLSVTSDLAELWERLD